MKTVPMTEELYKYVTDNSIPAEKLMDELLQETEKLEIPLIQISPDQARFLYLLCRMINARTALEIGTLTGYSGIQIARGLAHNGKLTTVEIEKKHGDIAKKYFEKAGVKDKTEVVISPGIDQMKRLISEGKKFDLIFIDADKTSYPDYFEAAIALSHKGTPIIMDNMLKGGRVLEDAGEDADLKAIQITNELIRKDTRVESMIVAIGDGFVMAVVK